MKLALGTRSAGGHPRARAVVGALALSLMGACRAPEPPVWGVAKAIRPFSLLDSLRLPLTLGDVLEQRPGSLRMDYGVRGGIDRAEVQYKAERAGYHEHPPLDSRVELVSATWEFNSDDAATVRWNELLNDVAQRSGQDPVCERVVGTQYQIHQAGWRIGAGRILLSQQYSDSVTTDGERLRVPAAVAIVVAPDSSALANEYAAGEPTPCFQVSKGSGRAP